MRIDRVIESARVPGFMTILVSGTGRMNREAVIDSILSDNKLVLHRKALSGSPIDIVKYSCSVISE